MRKIDLFYGFLIGIAAAFLGTFIFVYSFINHDFGEGLETLKAQDNLGKVITLGAILNLIAFFLLLKYKKELMARGVVLATIILTILTITV